MISKSRLKKYCLFFILFVNLVSTKVIEAQSVGSLFMLQESFYGQMLNPAFLRNDESVIFSVPGIAGATFVNNANFKITDLIRKQSNGEVAIDPEHFYQVGKSTSRMFDMISVPMVYVSIPTESGRLSLYYKEQININGNFKTEAIDFLVRGNGAQNLKSYNTNNGALSLLGYREFASGYTWSLNENTNIGVRAKLLFGAGSINVNDWQYGIETSEDGSVVTISSRGEGEVTFPYDIVRRDKQIIVITSPNRFWKYLSNYRNPGFSLDLGVTHTFNKSSQVAFSIRDLGGIFFRKFAYDIYQDQSYDFTGFEFANSLDYLNQDEYVDPQDIMSNAWDNLRNVFRPYGDRTKYFKAIAPITALHYQFDYSEKISFGITNQTAFYKSNLLNTLSISSLQRSGRMTFFENINLYGASQVTIGGGLQWETRSFQMLLATDNLLAVYHPATQKSFSATVGVSFFINNKTESLKTEGTFSPYRPFYKNLK